MFLLVFSGLSGTGKTTLSNAVSNALRWKLASCGDIVRAEARRLGHGNADRTTLQDVGETWVSCDPNGFSQQLLRSVTWVSGENLVVDGVRHGCVLKLLQRLTCAAQTKVVFMHADAEVRMNRLGLGEPGLSLRALDEHPVEADAATLESTADLNLNSGDNLTHNIEEVLRSISLTQGRSE